jgi:hypothetical protein
MLALLASDTQPRFPINPMHSFVVHIFSAAPQQNMQAASSTNRSRYPSSLRLL